MPFADVNGTRLYYEVQGAGPTLLFLHGFTLDHRMWRRQVEGLAARFRVITYDARGFGQSAMPTEGKPYKHCEDAAALCRHLAIDRVIVIGQSIGAQQMLEFALTEPNLVAGWVAVCYSGLPTLPFPDEIQQTFAAVRQAAATDVDEAKRIWSRCSWFATVRESPALSREFAEILADYSGWHWTHDNPAQSIDPPAATRLGELRARALVIDGERDLPYNARIGDILCSSITGAIRLTLPRAGHMANMEDPDAVNRAIAEFAADM